MFPCVNAEENVLVSNVSVENNTVSVSGVGNGDYVNIFLLNPGKTISDLNASDSKESLKAAANHMNVVDTDSDGGYSYTFNINNPVGNEDYLLYVKSGASSYSQTVTPVDKISVYVSADATAEGDGSENSPFSTIEAARDYVRTLDKTMPVDVIIKGGIYPVSSTITIGSDDSGTEKAPVTYKAAEGEKVILTGAKSLDISKFKRVTDKDIINRVYPQVADNLIEIDLAEQGISKELADYTVSLSATLSSKPVGVYLNDVYQNVARWPDSGYKTISKIPSDGFMGIGKTEYVTIDGASGRNSWANAENMFVEGYFGNNWCAEWVKVDSVGSDNDIKLASEPYYGIVKNQRIAVVNLLEELDTPGEWYINTDTMKMYYYPPHKLSSSDKFEIAALTDSIMTLQDAQYVNVEGISFEKTANNPKYPSKLNGMGSGLVILRTDYVNVKNCEFTNIGMDGLQLLDAQNIKVDGCYVYNTGYNGIYIKMAGDIKTLESGNVTVSNCYIAKAARDSGKTDSSALYLDQCVGVTLKNNILRDAKNSAVLYVQSVLNTICNNEIYNSVNETSDAGAIYAGRTFVNYGNTIEKNYFHEIGAELDSYLASAVFFDDAHSGNIVKNNIIDMGNKNYSAGVKINGGRDNEITDNIIANTSSQIYQQDLSDLKNIDDSFFESELFNTFKYATTQSDSLDIKNIGDSDWLPQYKSKFPGIIANYNNIIQKKYTRENTVSGTSSSYTDENLAGIGISDTLTLDNSAKKFELVYPHNGESIANTGIVLKWSLSPFADKYIYEVATDSDFNTIVENGETKSQINSVELSSLEKDTTYYWRVKAVNVSNQLAEEVMCNEAFSFVTGGKITIANITVSGTTLNCTVSNSKSSNETVYVIAAVKNSDNRLISVDIKPVTVNAGGSDTPSLSINGKASDNYAEVYLWNSLTDIKPLVKKRIIE